MAAYIIPSKTNYQNTPEAELRDLNFAASLHLRERNLQADGGNRLCSVDQIWTDQQPTVCAPVGSARWWGITCHSATDHRDQPAVRCSG